MKRFFLLCGMIALALGATGSASAETISIAASDNAWVYKDQLGTNQSEAERLEVRRDGDSSKSKLTYLRFDVSPLADATITSASLDLYCLAIDNPNTISVVALNDLADGGLGTSETSWTGNLTWNTQPSGTAKVPNTNTSGVLASLPFLTDDAPKLVSFDLTSALPGLLDSDTNNQLTLILYGSSFVMSNFASLANTGGYPVPTLNVTGEGFNPEAAIPEPGTLALLGMALLGLGFYVWRRRVPKIAVAAIIAFGLAAAVQAETISIAASDNAWIAKDVPDTDQDEQQQLIVLSNAGNPASKFTYLRFDVSPLANATITSANLDMYWLSSQDNSKVYVCALNDLANGGQATETSWSGNLTWNTRPQGLGNALNGNTSGLLTNADFVKGATPKLVSFDLTSKLPGLLDSDTNNQLTLILYGNTPSNKCFASLANTSGKPVPTLNVEFIPNAISEPGTLALLGMALLGLGSYAWRRRRR